MLFIITADEDGALIQPMTEETFLSKLNTGDYGQNPEFVTTLEGNENANYWGGYKILVIRGELIVPGAMRVVSEWGLPK